MSIKVEILRRTPFAAPGDIVEVEEEVFEAYDRDTMIESKADLTVPVDHTLPADTTVRKNDEVKVEETSEKDMTDIDNKSMQGKTKKK